MRVLLVGPDLEENLSLRYLAAALRQGGHQAQLASFEQLGQLPQVVAQARGTDLVGLSMAFQARAPQFLQLARALKRAGVGPIVAGGHYASCAAEDLLSCHPEVDMVLLHEAERSLVELADARAQAASLHLVPGLAYREADQVRFSATRPILADLDQLPFPDRSGPVRLLAGVPTAYLLGSRGCLGSCHYCCIRTLHRLCPGPRFRQRAEDAVADEMAALYHGRGIRQFVFHDDNFLVPSAHANHQRLDSLRGALRERGVGDLALVIKCRPQDAERSVFENLRDMGLVRVFMGVESASAAGLRSIGRRQRVQDAEAALELCEDLGISAQFGLLIFHPEATLDTVRADLTFLRRYQSHPLNFSRAEIYAGTPLERRMLDEGRACGDHLARDYRMADARVELAYRLVQALLHGRCWKHESLLQRAIGMEHLAAVLERFYPEQGAATLASDIRRRLLSVNRVTTDLLEAVVQRCQRAPDPQDLGLQRDIEALAAAERHDRAQARAAYQVLGQRLDALTDARTGLDQVARGRRPVGRLARHAAVVLGLVATVGVQACGYGVCEYAAPDTGHFADEPDIFVTPDELQFGAVSVGGEAEEELSIVNSGLRALEITELEIEGSSAFSIEGEPGTLASQEEQVLILRFLPQEAGEHSGALTIRSNDPDEPVVEVPLVGEGE